MLAEPAVYHNDIRPKLLEVASRSGQDTYDHPRQRGRGMFDETAFHEAHRHWGPNRQDWPKITDDILNRLEREDYPTQNYDVGVMIDEGRIVLDADNHPVKDYRDIPLTLSSEVEGWLLEAMWRLDSRIERMDWRARMPKQIQKPDGQLHELYGLSAISNRSTRFRKAAGLVSWNERSGSKTINKFIMDRLTEAQQKNENFSGLSKEEQEEAKRPNKGQHMSRAGSRALSDAERLKREQKQKKWKASKLSTENLVEDSIESSRKRKRATQSSDQENFDQEDSDQEDRDSPQNRLRRSTSKAQSKNEHPSNDNSQAGFSLTPQTSRGATSSSTFENPDVQLAQHDEASGRKFGLGMYALESNSGPRTELGGAGFDPTMRTYPPSPDIDLNEQIGMGSGASHDGRGCPIGPHQDHHMARLPNQSRKRSLSASAATDDSAGRLHKKQQLEATTSQGRHSVNEEQVESRAYGLSQPSPNQISRLPPYESRVWNPELEALQDHAVSPSSPTLSPTIAGVSQEEAIQPEIIPEVPQSPVDYRFIPPSTFSDAASIASAIHLSVRDYRGLFPHLESIPPTSYWASYATQYRQLQASAAEQWRITYGECPMLNLGHLQAWSGGWDGWNGDTFSEDWEEALCGASEDAA